MIKIHPKEFRFVFGLGLLEFLRKNNYAAIQNFKETIELKKQFELSYECIAWIYFKATDPYEKEQKKQWAKLAYKVDSLSIRNRIVMASCQIDICKRKKLFENLINEYPESIVSKVEMTYLCLTTNDEEVEEGIKIIENCILIQPKNWYIYNFKSFLMSYHSRIKLD